MSRVLLLSLCALTTLACGAKPRPIPDGGLEEDAGVEEVDAGRPRGTDPASGWQTAVELPAGAAPGTRLGVSLATAPDQFNQPLIAALHDDPNGDGNRDDTRVVFTRWSGADSRFEALRTVEVVGPVSVEHPARQVSIARDPVTGRIGIAYIKGETNSVRFAWSDDEGANFSLTTASEEPSAALKSNPSLALRDGTVHLAWVQGSDVRYRKRAGQGAFADEALAAVPAGQLPVSLALDAQGRPAVAFFSQVSATEFDLAFWRVGQASVIVVTGDRIDLTPAARRPSVSLLFEGTTPHLAYHRRTLEPLATADDTPELFYVHALDEGATWAAPVAIPRNGTMTNFHSTRWYQALALDASGRVSVAANFAFSGGQTQCGGPKLARSPDGTQFTTCAPAGSPVQLAGEWISMWPHAPGKQSIFFFYDQRANPNLKPGIAMWREP